MKINDSTAGFVCYRDKVLETINLDKIRFKGYAFQIEMKFNAWKHGFNSRKSPSFLRTGKKENPKCQAKSYMKQSGE